MVPPTRKLPWKNLAGVLLLPVALYLLFRLLEQRSVFQPTRALDATGRELGREFEDVWLTAADGVRVNGWFFTATPGSAMAQRVFLICHGNAGNISHRLPLVRALLETGANVFVFDYRGYGRSSGRPGEAGTYLDAEAAHAWLVGRGFKGADILAYGESLGGAVAAELATRRELGGLVLQSSFTSAPEVGAGLFPWLPVRTLARHRFETLAKLPRLRLPVLVMHGRADTIIPFRHGGRLFAAANEPKLLWELDGDHNDQPHANPRKFGEGLEKFLGMVESASRARPTGTGAPIE